MRRAAVTAALEIQCRPAVMVAAQRQLISQESSRSMSTRTLRYCSNRTSSQKVRRRRLSPRRVRRNRHREFILYNFHRLILDTGKESSVVEERHRLWNHHRCAKLWSLRVARMPQSMTWPRHLEAMEKILEQMGAMKMPSLS